MLKNIPPKLNELITVVCEDNNVQPSWLLTERRSKREVYARWMAYLLVREFTPHTYNKIAVIFNKDHKSVYYAFNQMDDNPQRFSDDFISYKQLYENWKN